jgi:hypothetical protein
MPRPENIDGVGLAKEHPLAVPLDVAAQLLGRAPERATA